MANINWKARALDRRIKNKKITKRVKELTVSRDKWKNKALARKKEIDSLRKQVSMIKKNIQNIIGM